MYNVKFGIEKKAVKAIQVGLYDGKKTIKKNLKNTILFLIRFASNQRKYKRFFYKFNFND